MRPAVPWSKARQGHCQKRKFQQNIPDANILNKILAYWIFYNTLKGSYNTIKRDLFQGRKYDTSPNQPMCSIQNLTQSPRLPFTLFYSPILNRLSSFTKCSSLQIYHCFPTISVQFFITMVSYLISLCSHQLSPDVTATFPPPHMSQLVT